ncbi:MAG: type IV toxin-antitoxin system AbiEi family antitoxin domain-containing protein [Pseudonocardiaceae bacterium]
MAAGNLAGMTEGNDLERLLCRQHGAVSRTPLRDIGLSVTTIESWVRRGRLRRLLHGVYCAGAPTLATRARAAYL